MNISEIAELAGVSRATVSRFFNNGYLSQEKRRRIQAVIDETGYIPSASAQALRTKKSRQIGVIVPKISSESISSVVQGLSTVLGDQGYHVILGNTDNSLEKEKEYMRVFQNNGVDGIIFIATCFTKRHVQELKKLTMPIVIVGQELEGFCCVYHDDFHAAKDIAAILAERSSGPVAYLGVTEKDKAAGLLRKEGFLEGLRESGVPEEKKRIRICDFDYDSGYNQMKDLLEKEPEVNSVFCATDTIACGAMEAARDMGKRIPQDIIVAGIGGNRLSRVVTPKLTTARYFYRQSGEEAAKMLLGAIGQQEVQVKHLMLGYEILERESTRA